MTFLISKQLWRTDGWFFIQDLWFAAGKCGRSQAY